MLVYMFSSRESAQLFLYGHYVFMCVCVYIIFANERKTGTSREEEEKNHIQCVPNMLRLMQNESKTDKRHTIDIS